MSSVTHRIAQIKQPRGGYIKPSQFDVYRINDEYVLYDNENVHASIIGMVVDYLTRCEMGADPKNTFIIACMGAARAEEIFGQKNAIKNANKLLRGIKGIDKKSIINACKLVTYDVWFRNPMGAMMARGADAINPDIETVQNIRILIERSVKFWEIYGPIVQEGFTFEPYGYTETVDSGDGDYLTVDTLWDFKVSRKKPTSKHTLQLLMYWIMGQHSGQQIFRNIKKLGIFNPRLNEVYLLDVRNIPQEVIFEIEQDVICY